MQHGHLARGSEPMGARAHATLVAGRLDAHDNTLRYSQGYPAVNTQSTAPTQNFCGFFPAGEIFERRRFRGLIPRGVGYFHNAHRVWKWLFEGKRVPAFAHGEREADLRFHFDHGSEPWERRGFALGDDRPPGCALFPLHPEEVDPDLGIRDTIRSVLLFERKRVVPCFQLHRG
jgi:hypothetical protein